MIKSQVADRLDSKNHSTGRNTCSIGTWTGLDTLLCPYRFSHIAPIAPRVNIRYSLEKKRAFHSVPNGTVILFSIYFSTHIWSLKGPFPNASLEAEYG